MDKHMITLSNGVAIPDLGFGTWKAADGPETEHAVECALSTGYRHIDCAAIYANERSVGAAIARSGVERGELFVTSKVWATDRGYDTTLRAFHKSLADLGLDYLDLYLIHWPASPSRFGNWKEINSRTWQAMEHLLERGLVKAIGVSNFLPHHLEALMADAQVAPMVNQIEYHPGFMQPETVEFCSEHGIAVEAWSPLGRGRVLDHPVLTALAAKYGKTTAQICLRWIVQHGVIALPKSVTPERIAENFHIRDFELTAADMALIDAMPLTGQSGLDPDRVTF